ncbi:hypothetical protein [Hydrogenophaga sp. NFH-34]|uniref:hypothetical protein n=1 Tax=Hydrogenophaga sp. NFH-34 TaxID=2744446 RepID=UPI001F2CC6DC|nr:hypothetical protein [Hydrogenophaga sp. NFH-34]
MLEVNYQAKTVAGSDLRIKAQLSPEVQAMVAWILMSDSKDVQPVLVAFHQAQQKESA